MKKTLILALCAMMLAMLALGGCSLKGGSDNDKQDAGTANIDRSSVVVKVGNTDVTYAEYERMFNIYLAYYRNWEYDPTADEAALAEFQDFIISLLVDPEVIRNKATELGFDKLDAEGQAEFDKYVADTVEEMKTYFSDLAKEQIASGQSTLDQAALEEDLFSEYMESTLPGATYEEYIALVKSDAELDFYIEKVRDHVFSAVAVTEEDILAKYNEALQSAKTAYADNPEDYLIAQEAADSNETTPVLYVPEGYSRIMHIVISSEEALPEDYSLKQAEIEELTFEYGKLALEDAEANSARLAEISARVSALKQECETMLKTQFAEQEQKAKEAYAKLEGGAKFADVMKEYTVSPEFTDYPAFMEKGKLISRYEDGSLWSDAVREQFYKLSPGRYSEVFLDENGYNIIYYVADETPGERSFESVKATLQAEATAEDQEAAWNEQLELWKSLITVEYNEELIRSMKGTIATTLG